MRLIKALIVLLLFGLQVACSEYKYNDFDQVPAASLDFACDIAQSPECAKKNVGKIVYVGMVDNPDFNCEDELAGVSLGHMQMKMNYYGQTVAQHNGLALWGIVRDWYSWAGGKMLFINNATYKVCAFVDVNDDGMLSIAEPLGEMDWDASNDNFDPITTWIHL